MEVNLAAAKVKKYATSHSGDTLEVIERPGGGLSIVLADGQSSGRGAKHISNLVVRKVISLLAEGVRDGAAARAASDTLFHERKGKVQATLNILSIDLLTESLVITRNNPAPVYLVQNGTLGALDSPCTPVGIYRATRPSIQEMDLEEGLFVLTFTDGLSHAGKRKGNPMDISAVLMDALRQPDHSPSKVADHLLATAVDLDQGRPADDISVVALAVTGRGEDAVRRMTVRLPFGS